MSTFEIHFIGRNYFKMQNYLTYNTIYHDGTAHGGTLILINTKIKNHETLTLTKTFYKLPT